MKTDYILNLLEEYYLNDGTDTDLEVVLDYIQNLNSLSYFYWITKQWEMRLNNINTINENAFQVLMLKWFTDCLELNLTKV